jgi:molybdopterin molybdotransferase
MTGSILPLGTDTVVRYEDLEMAGGDARVIPGVRLRRGQNVHWKGTDRRKGTVLIRRGTRIDERHAGILASVGKTRVKVSRLPLVSIVTTGDELVPAGKKPKAHQIRASNGAALEAGVRRLRAGRTRRFHLRDDWNSVRRGLVKILTGSDVTLLTGGVSMGKKDYLPRALSEAGVRRVFHNVSQRPGKPFWFGRTRRGNPVFGLPGNPVSVLTCFRRYVVPWLNKASGMDEEAVEWAALTEAVAFKPALTYFLPVKIDCGRGGRLDASPAPTRGSGDFAGLVKSDGFLELPEEKAHFRRGETFRFFRWNG